MLRVFKNHSGLPLLQIGTNQMKITCMSEDVDVESTFVKSVESAVRSQACSKNTSALILMSGLMCASCVTLLSRRKVGARFLSELLF